MAKRLNLHPSRRSNNNPGLLLADEPTNNLDMDHLLWLEKELRHYSGALILVFHDRDFLDALCNEIWALDDKQLQI